MSNEAFAIDQTETADGCMRSSAGGRRPPAMIESTAVRASKRRIALVTIWVPTIGTLCAVALALRYGVHLLEIVLLASMYFVTMAGVEVGLHRLFAHNAFKCGSAMRALFGITGSMAAQGPVLYWAATHRRHHIFSDTLEDPHSPHVRKADDGREQRFMSRMKGLWHAQMGNMYTDHATNVMAFTRDLARVPVISIVDRHYRTWVALGLAIPTVIGAVAKGTAYGALLGLLWGGLVRIFLVHHVYFANGSFSHMYGPRPFATGDESSNNYVFGVPTFGSAWQNNHHAFPASALLGFEWHQPDVGGAIIRAMSWLGLVTDVRRAPTEEEKQKRARARVSPATEGEAGVEAYVVGETAAPEAGTVRPSITVENKALRPMQNAIAGATILVPLLGALSTVAYAWRYGVGTLEIALCVGGFVLTSLGIEFGLHRALAHRAFETSRIVKVIFAVLGSMAAEGRVLYWVASHRRHHAHSDGPHDPHSPHVRKIHGSVQSLGLLRGLWHAHIGHMLTDEITNCTLFARDIVRDPVLRVVNALYLWIAVVGLALPAIIGGIYYGTFSGALSCFLWGGLLRMFLVHQTTWSVASICHRFGGERFRTGDKSRNNFWLAVPSFGSAWQNNHHAFPSSAHLGLRWWEIDLTAFLIEFFAKVGIVRNVKRPTVAQLRRQSHAESA